MNENLKRWLPFIIGFVIGVGWLFLVFYDMNYSNAFFSKSWSGEATGIEKMTTADLLKIYLPMGMLFLFIIITWIVRNLKKSRKTFYHPKKRKGKRTFHRKIKKLIH